MTLLAAYAFRDSVLLKLFGITESSIELFLGFKVKFERVANFAVRGVCLEEH